MSASVNGATLNGAGIRMEGLDAALAGLRSAAQGLADATPLYDEIGAEGALSTQRRFETETDPDGKIWPKSWRAKQDGGKTLQGRPPRLLDSITHNAGPNFAEWGSNVLYAAIHNFGGVIRAKNGKSLRFSVKGRGANRAKDVFVKSVTIPRRTFIGLNQADVTAITRIVEAYLARITDSSGGPDAAR